MENNYAETRLSRNRLHRSESAHLDFECLKNIHKNQLLSDVVLVAENKEIPAHRLILALASTYFYWRFSKERYLDVSDRIEIENVSYQTLMAIVSYLYNSEISITEENAKDLLAASDIFILRDLRKACCEFLQDNLTPSNCLSTRNIASLCHCQDLVQVADFKVLECFSEVISHDECLELRYDQVAELIQCDRLCSTEEDVLEYVIKWIRGDLENRKVFVYNLMSYVRFSLLSQKYVLQRLEQEAWLMSDQGYDSFLIKILKSYVLGKPSTLLSRPRQSKHLVVAGLNEDNNLSLELYDFWKDTWYEGPLFDIDDNHATFAIVGLKLYCLTRQMLQLIDISDFTQSLFTECEEFFDDRSASKMAVLDNSVYIVGGQRGRTVLESAARFDISSEQWEDVEEMPHATHSSCVGIINGNLYSIGGVERSTNDCSSVHCFNPQQGCWYSLSEMLTRRSLCGVANFEGGLYVVGGKTDEECIDQVEVFNPEKLSWNSLPSMNVARSSPGVTEVNGLLYVIGGYNDTDGYLTSVEVYNPNSKTWTVLPSSMMTGKRQVVAALVDRRSMKY